MNFKPNFGLTLNEAAKVCGVDHFNWLQYVVGIPPEWTVHVFSSGQILSPPIPDPILNYSALNNHYIVTSSVPGVTPTIIPVNTDVSGGDKGTYWNDSALSLPGIEPDDSTLNFYDRPGMTVGMFIPGETMDFVTELVGVDANGNVLDTWAGLGTTFTWSTDTIFAGDTSYFDAFDDGPTLISGGISNIRFDGVPEGYQMGDANEDGKVDGADLAALLVGYENNLVGWTNGDFNGDGVINADDFALFNLGLAEYNNSIGQQAPEPSVVGSTALLTAIGGRGRRSKAKNSEIH